MSKPQYAILRFAKYKGPEIGNIEAHNERTKEKYASNPDVDISRSQYNFHLVEPQRKYRAEAERQIKEVPAEIAALLDQYIPAVEQMHSTMKKYQVAFTETTVENKKLKQENAQLEQSLEKATQESTLKQLADAKLQRDYEDAVAVLDRIPKEVLAEYMHKPDRRRINAYDR